jgi:hypothetical protein
MSDVKEAGRRVEQLLDSLASPAEPQLRLHAEELVSLLLSLYGEGLARVISLVPEQVRAELAGDDLVSELLVLHGLHPVDIESRVRAVVGDAAELVGVDAAGVARLRLAPAAGGCGCGSADLPRRLEALVLGAVSDVTAVEIEQAPKPLPLIPVDSLLRHRPSVVSP